MAMLCTVLIDKGRFEEAFNVGLAAVEAVPDDMEVRDLVSATLSIGVPKWHRPMLHDEARNAAYALALERTVKPGMIVLEIGTGAGLLSLMAARLGAEVYTCEANPMIAAAAKVISAKNGLAHRIHVIPKISTRLEIGLDIPRPVDMLMSELFDDTFFGDGIVSYIADAKHRLLNEDAIIVPAKAELRLALVDLVLPEKHRPLAIVEDFDLSAFNILAPRSSSFLRARKLDARARSVPISILSKNFCLREPFGNDREDAELVSSGGRITGIAQWLRIEFSADNDFENSPFDDRTSHWGSPITLLANPIQTEAEQRVPITAKRFDRELFYNLSEPLT